MLATTMANDRCWCCHVVVDLTGWPAVASADLTRQPAAPPAGGGGRAAPAAQVAQGVLANATFWTMVLPIGDRAIMGADGIQLILM